jgi:cytochrome P460
MRPWILLCLAFLFPGQYDSKTAPAEAKGNTSASQTPEYTPDGHLKLPANYREWIYLTSGIDMSYSPNRMDMGHSMFDNVFVNPDAYKAFLQTGTWPDKTMLVLEPRMAGSNASINKSGHFQTTEIMGHEVHVKDEARFPGKWAFFGFDGDSPAKQVPKEAACYSCHQQHAAVDTTFVQFYPTLIELAKKKGTLSPAYLKEEAENAKK